MPAIATIRSLSDYSKLNISTYRNQLKQSDEPFLELNYQYRNKLYSYSIQLSKSACHYGNYRYWWLCPKCSKRVSVLYCAGLYVCRHCIGANYGSQLQQPVDRLFTRLNAIRARLQWSKGVANKQGGKPHYMHQNTYERLLAEYEQLEQKLIRSFN